MADDDPVSVVRRYLEGLRAMNPEAMLAEVDDNLVLELPYMPAPMPKRVETKQGLIEFFGPLAQGLWAELEFSEFDIKAYEDGEGVIAEYSSWGKFTNGKPYNQVYANICRVQNGKIVYTKEFFDPIQLAPGLEGLPGAG